MPPPPVLLRRRELTEKRWAEAQIQTEIYLTKAANDYPDVTSADTKTKIGPRADAALIGLNNMPNLLAGQLASDIRGKDLQGSNLKLSDQKGKVVLLVFWYSSCGYCLADVPHELELAAKFKDRPFVIIGVNGDENKGRPSPPPTKPKCLGDHSRATKVCAAAQFRLCGTWKSGQRPM